MGIVQNKKGMTLVEILIAVSLFSVVAMVAASVLLDIVELEKRSSIQNVFYEDVRLIMQQLTNEIQGGAIDYEEYYNRYVIHKNSPNDGFFGVNYGVYASRFYDPGKRLDGAASVNPKDLGVDCSFPPGASVEDCEIVYTLSTDLNTGQNPFEKNGSKYTSSNALCDSPGSSTCSDQLFTGHVGELYLIDSTGLQKTIIVRKSSGSFESDYSLGMVKLEGLDIDQNGVIDTWRCKEEYYCYGLGTTDETGLIADAISHNEITTKDDVLKYKITLPEFGNINDPFSPFDQSSFSNFVPITPKRSSIKNLTFIIHPIEDPYRAFGEPDVQAHPSVTIIMTIGLSEAAEKDYPGQFTDITVQTTVTAGVLGKINSYPPTNDVSWIDDVPNVPSWP